MSVNRRWAEALSECASPDCPKHFPSAAAFCTSCLNLLPQKLRRHLIRAQARNDGERSKQLVTHGLAVLCPLRAFALGKLAHDRARALAARLAWKRRAVERGDIFAVKSPSL